MLKLALAHAGFQVSNVFYTNKRAGSLLFQPNKNYISPKMARLCSPRATWYSKGSPPGWCWLLMPLHECKPHGCSCFKTQGVEQAPGIAASATLAAGAPRGRRRDLSQRGVRWGFSEGKKKTGRGGTACEKKNQCTKSKTKIKRHLEVSRTTRRSKEAPLQT